MNFHNVQKGFVFFQLRTASFASLVNSSKLGHFFDTEMTKKKVPVFLN